MHRYLNSLFSFQHQDQFGLSSTDLHKVALYADMYTVMTILERQDYAAFFGAAICIVRMSLYGNTSVTIGDVTAMLGDDVNASQVN